MKIPSQLMTNMLMIVILPETATFEADIGYCYEPREISEGDIMQTRRA